MLFSLTQAAKASGKSKSVLSGAIQSGRISASRNDKGHWEIDAAELFRVYPQALAEPVLERGTRASKKNGTVPPIEPLELKLLEQQVSAKDEKISFLQQQYEEKTAFFKSQLEEAKARENELLAIVKNQTLLLTHEKERPASSNSKRRWFGLLSA